MGKELCLIITVEGGQVRDDEVRRISEWWSTGRRQPLLLATAPGVAIKAHVIGAGAREAAESAEIKVTYEPTVPAVYR